MVATETAFLRAVHRPNRERIDTALVCQTEANITKSLLSHILPAHHSSHPPPPHPHALARLYFALSLT